MAAIKNNAERLTRLIMDWLHSRKAQVVLITITIAWFSYSEPAHTITGPPHSMSRCLLCNIVNNIEPDEPIWVFWSSWCRFVHFFFHLMRRWAGSYRHCCYSLLGFQRWCNGKTGCHQIHPQGVLQGNESFEHKLQNNSKLCVWGCRFKSSPFSVSVTWFSISSYFASSWDRKDKNTICLLLGRCWTPSPN